MVAPRGSVSAAGAHSPLIVIGHGAVGAEVVREARRLGVEVAVVEHQAEQVAELVRRGDPGIHLVLRDALRRDALVEAGIDRCRGVITTLAALRDNLFLCVLARHARPDVPIVARIGDMDDASKFKGVGATVVNPARIGGIRLTRLMILPELADFTDAVVASSDHPELIRTLDIEKRSAVAGRRLADAKLQRRTGCVILGLRAGKRGPFRYHPSGRLRLKPGGAVVALGEQAQLEVLAGLLSASAGAASGPWQGGAGRESAGRPSASPPRHGLRRIGWDFASPDDKPMDKPSDDEPGSVKG